MSEHFSFPFFSLLVVLSLFHLCFSNQKFDDDVLCIGSEREALVQFMQQLIDEGNRLSSWNDGKERDCCRWFGIGCDNVTGHVHSIHLRALDGNCNLHYTARDRDYKKASEERLSGNLSSSLFNLKQLRHLDLSCNDFGGIKVPKFIGSLKNLRYLNLSRSNFGGLIPPQLGNLSELHVLSLGSFHRQIETTIMMNMQWLSRLRSLHHLDLSHMDLSKETDWLQVINTLPSLVELHLSSCQLSSTNAHVFSLNLSSLSVLNLSSNYFRSDMPPWIFRITSLVSLDLSNCYFDGLIPRSNDGFRNLTSLKFLHVSGNDFMNSSLVLKGLSSVGTNLVLLDLSSCGVSNHVLDSLYNLTSLLSLDLSSNQLTKRIPKSLGNFCNLREIDLSGNKFGNNSLTILLESVFKCKSPHLESLILSSSELSGTVPDPTGRLPFLRSLGLSRNLISCPIPSSIGHLSSLKKLDLSNNDLNGILPYSIGQLSYLEVLDLSGNSIVGTIPDSLGRLSYLENLDISYNRLDGGLPTSLGQLSNLERFSFSSNLLTGVVTQAHFSKLVSLKFLYGGRNNLILQPRLANWIPPFQLLDLNLNTWVVGPQFPLWLQSQKDLELLSIRNTSISSTMPPESFWRSLPYLTYLDMSHNYIQGTLTLLRIPTKLWLLDLSFNKLIGKLTPISSYTLPYVLYLSNNLFDGSLHDLLCSNGVQKTLALSLENNQLSGIIPDCWDKWPELLTLNLENNHLSGEISRSMGSSYNLRSLNMHGNKLSGRLPDSLMNLTNLKILQLGRNKFVGSIPSWLGRQFSHLGILNLRFNDFEGNIPLELCYLKHIQILDLAHNNLAGSIPRCFNNFSVLCGKESTSSDQFMYDELYITKLVSDSLVTKGHEYTYSTILPLLMLLDFSNNNISGNIPSELTLLLKLQSLNLSRNHLRGRIPDNIGNLKALETFDLSLNKLSGELPMTLSNLNSLSSFNVSYNSLKGTVPISTQLQSLDESSFFGNKLCGPPLIERCAIEVVVSDIEDGGVDWGLIDSIVLGFVCGFWIVLAPLIVSRPWRIAYFRFMNELGYIAYDFMYKYCFNMFCK